ncbi:uncharacterized protein [Dysidea avara]|uniref:uncharacterized protein n=1 Tax=Dysidea avara TaxID=196820 RepID=UPI003316589C
MSTILTEVEARETSEGARILSQKSVVHPKTHVGGFNPTANSLVTNNYTVKCVYCGEAHYSASCKKVVSVKDRKEVLIRMGRCFVCLKSSHRVRDCESHRNCRYCHRRHHQSLCEPQTTNQHDHNVEQVTPVEDTTANTINTVKSRQLVSLQTARAEATNGSETSIENVRILFDNGSQRSYITDSLKTRLGLSPIRKEKLNLNTFGYSKFKTQNCDVVRVYLRKPGSENLYCINALSFPTICSALPSPVDLSAYPVLNELELADCQVSPGQNHIDILVGSDFYWSLVTGEIIRTERGLKAVCSTLGWLISGPAETAVTEELAHTHSNLAISYFNESSSSESQDDQLVTALKKFWEVETLGIECIENAPSDDIFLQGLKFKGNRYEVGLPWIGDHVKLSDNRDPCFSSLKLLHKRLLKNPDIVREYDCVIQDQLERGIIERIPMQQTNKEKGSIHYMPHHPVIRKGRSTTKVRVVYDGSAKLKESGLSLNDCLQTGPNLIPRLFDVVVRFRSHLIALTADIEKAFLMIGISDSDRDMLRFLWFKDPHREDSEVVQFRFTRLVFGMRPSPAILGAVIAHHTHKYHDSQPELCQCIERSLYVDDLIAGADTIGNAFKLYKTAKSVMSDGGFNLRKWNSNSPSLLTMIKSEQNNQKPKLEFDRVKELEPHSDNLLGIQWFHEPDEFRFCFGELQAHARGLPSNKRTVLRVTAAILDPMGFLSPFVILLKVMFQTLKSLC